MLLASPWTAPARADSAAASKPITGTGTGNNESEITVPGAYGGYMDKIHLFLREECINTLRPIVSPESVIAAGLDALQDSQRTTATLSCLDEILPAFGKTMKDPALTAAQIDNAELVEEDLQDKKLQTAYEELSKKVACTNPYVAGSPEGEYFVKNNKGHCKDKFFDPLELSATKAQNEKARQTLLEYRFAQKFDRNLGELTDTFVPKLEPSAELEQVRLQLKCIPNPYGTLPEHCMGKSLPESERAAVMEKSIKLTNELAAANQKYYETRQALSQLLAHPATVARLFDLPKLKDKFRRLKCLGGVTSYYGSGYEASEKKTYCLERGLPTEGDQAALKKDIRAFLPDPAAAVAQWNADAGKREEERKKRRELLKADNQVNYGLRRLLTLYKWHARRNPAESDPLGSFCAANEKIQMADAAYARKLKSLATFNSDSDWEWVSKNGASESGLSAIRRYTGSGYGQINQAIWKSKAESNAEPLSEEFEMLRSTINEALARGLPYNEKPVRRFAEALPAAVLAAHQEGSIVTYDAFTSTSKKENWTWGSGSAGTAHGFLIYSGRGVYVDDVSSSKGEEEVLFKAGTRFKILSRKKRRPDAEVYDFVMAEVDEAGNLIASLPKEEKAGGTP